MTDPTARQSSVSPTAKPASETVLELAEEEVTVLRQAVQGQTVRIATVTNIREQQVEEALSRETVQIERIAIGRVVESAPSIREEGDVTIVPVMEEVLVLERRLILKEEIRIKRIRTAEIHRETVQLREQAAIVTRTDPADRVAAVTSPTIYSPNERESQ